MVDNVSNGIKVPNHVVTNLCPSFSQSEYEINVNMTGIFVNYPSIEVQTVDMFSFLIVAFPSFSSYKGSGSGP